MNPRCEKVVTHDSPPLEVATDQLRDARRAVLELLVAFNHHRVSPCTTMALGNLAMIAGHVNHRSVKQARSRAAQQGQQDLERALHAAMAD